MERDNLKPMMRCDKPHGRMTPCGSEELPVRCLFPIFVQPASFGGRWCARGGREIIFLYVVLVVASAEKPTRLLVPCGLRTPSKVRQALDERQDGENTAAALAKLSELASELKALAKEIREAVSSFRLVW